MRVVSQNASLEDLRTLGSSSPLSFVPQWASQQTQRILPDRAPRKRLRYEKETWPPGSFRLLLVVV
jgi:hypothetical protein